MQNTHIESVESMEVSYGMLMSVLWQARGNSVLWMRERQGR